MDSSELNHNHGWVSWRDDLDERQLKEVEFAIIYARDFHHGTTGHNQLMLIAKMADELDRHELAHSEKE